MDEVIHLLATVLIDSSKGEPMAMFQVLVAFLILMGSVNVWFIMRLVRKIDKVDAVNSKLSIIQQDLKHIEAKMKELSDVYVRIVNLEKQVAVFEFVLKERISK